MPQEALCERHRVRDIVRAPVLAQQKCADVRGGGVIPRRRIVFQEMENGERREEKRGAPEWGRVGECEEGEGEGCAEAETEEEGAEGDSGEGFRAMGTVDGVLRGGERG